MAVAAEIGYTPNTAARHLRRSKVGALGLYMPRRVLGMSFYMEFAFGAAERARESHLDLTLLAPGPLADRLPQLRVDGLVIVDPLTNDPITAKLLAADLPVVTVGKNRGAGPAAAGVLNADHAAMVARLLDHLTSAGASLPGLIAQNADFQADWAALVLDAYHRWCWHRGVAPQVRTVATDATPEEVDRAVRDLIQQEPSIDAVVCAPDGTALRALGTLRSIGRHVGDDILLASCVGSPSLELCDPPITTIDLRPRQYGSGAVELLIEILAATVEPPTEWLHNADLLVRASTSPPPAT